MASSKKKKRKKTDNKNEKRWETLRHNGIIFPPEYESKGFTIRIRGKEIKPDLLQEEMAYQWAKKKDTPYVQDSKFQSNFTRDLAAALGPEYKGLKYKDVDFAEAYRIVDMEKDRKDAMTKEERKAAAAKRKEIREGLKAEYGKAVLDDDEVDVGNYMAEPPGIFIGRGKHPLRGKWKPRITKGDVTLNMSQDAPRPEGQWKSIVENRGATWLASWTDYLTQKTKYVWLADTSEIKQNMDKEKYLKAEKLASEIDKVLDNMVRDMSSKDPKKRNIATVCYMIYRTAMRVGDEKDLKEEADTVGATTLKRKHVKVTDNAVEFDFLGKDSVEWKETINADNPRDAKFRDNLERIIRDKKPKDDIFDGVNSRKVNAYYSGIVEGLSAKVFRTYSATKVVNKHLADHVNVRKKPSYQKLRYAKLANLEAAKTCNHKKTLPKNFEESLQKRKTKLADAKKKEPWVKSKERLKKAENSKPKTPAQEKKRAERIMKITEQIQRQKDRHKERIDKMKLQIALTEETKDYNLGTSLRNYIDPRVVKAWTDHTGAQWEKLYTAALQKKFLWVHSENLDWKKISRAYAEKDLQGTSNGGGDSTATDQTTPS